MLIPADFCLRDILFSVQIWSQLIVMQKESLTIRELAAFLQRDTRMVEKLALQGDLAGRKVGGEWRFARAEITRWLESNLPGYSDKELSRMEVDSLSFTEAVQAAVDSSEAGFGEPRSLLSKLLPPACVSLNMRAGTQSSVLRELAALAEQSWQVWDPVALLDSLREREERGSTAQSGGIAIPHPTRRLKAELGESVLAFARLASPIQFGSPDNQPTDLFFMVACRDDATHLQVLTRIARLIRLDGFLDTIRSFDSPLDFCHYMQEAEASLPPALGA